MRSKLKIRPPLAVLLALLWVSTISTHAQDNTVIQAKIIDAATRASVPFATVKIMRGREFRWGVISNGDGDFQIPSRYLAVFDSLVITCIGYENQVVKTNQLIPGKLNIIDLKTSLTKLPEVVVSPPKENAYGL